MLNWRLNLTKRHASRRGCELSIWWISVFVLLPASVTAQPLWPTIFMNAADQQRIEQQREAYRLSQTQGIPQPSRDSAVQTHVNPRLFSVDAIMNVQGQRLAIINGVSYAEKTVKNGIHVHRIFEGFVTLTLEESEQWGRAQVGVRYSSESWPDAIPNRVKLLKAN